MNIQSCSSASRGRGKHGLGLLPCLVLVAACGPTARVPSPARAEPAPTRIGIVPPPGPYAPGVDALHYGVALQLPDSGRRIRATTTVTLLLRAMRDSVHLDFTGLRALRVTARVAGDRLSVAGFAQDSARLRIALPRRANAGDTLRVTVDYDGEPDDGLIIRRNVHGEWSAFADNWPDRARFWFPAIDHPSDKATVDFEVTAPAHWDVVANGVATGVAQLTSRGRPLRLWRWRLDQPIPTYLMVVGATRFTIAPVNTCARGGASPLHPDGCVPVSWYAFPPDSVNAASVFRRSDRMLEFYATLIAPFPYPALAHVQSATRFGGMENAGAIFYSEQAIARGSLSEGTVAHETAHQWFGDAVTPGHWSDLWVSEGFATYFGHLFFQHADGEPRFREMTARSWTTYLQSDVTDLAIVDTISVPNDNLLDLLNANSYDKGGAVLHMLRGLLGDSAFFGGVRRYYERHRHGNARTAELRRALEEQSGVELGWFFEQWVYRPGHPVLNVSHSWDAATREAVVTIEQVQKSDWPVFRFPLDLAIATAQEEVRHRIEVTARTATARVRLPARPSALTVDPDGWLLHERR